MKIKKFITCFLCVALIVPIISAYVNADIDVSEDYPTITNTPRPEVELLSSDEITEEAVEKSTELYNNFLSVDPELFMLTDEGIGYLSWWGIPEDDELEYLENKSAEITKNCKNESEKIVAVMEYVAKNICYDYDYLNGYKGWRQVNLDPYDILINGSTICEGYARTTATLLQMADVACIYVDSPNHKWNMAYDGERWIMLDTTWISCGILEDGVLNKSDRLVLEWYDFTLGQANSNENHLIEELPFSVYDGVLTDFPEYTSQSELELPSSVKAIDDYVSFPKKINTLILPGSIESIGESCFYSSNIGKIYYEGSKAEFNKITIDSYNSGITNCSNITYADNAAKPYISVQPSNTIGAVGDVVSVSLTAECDNSNISYRWYKNDKFSNIGGTLVKNSNAATYEFTPESEGIVYLYAEVVSTDNSVSGEREVITKSIPISVEIFETCPTEIKKVGANARYITFEETKEAYLVGSGEVIGNVYDSDTTTLYISNEITSISGSLSVWYLEKIELESGNKSLYIDEYGALIDGVNKKIIKLPAKGEKIDTYVMPDDIVEVAARAFYCCTMKEVKMSPKLKKIGEESFWNCNNVKRYFIPASVEEIGSRAFKYSSNLVNVYFLGNTPKFGTEVFQNFENRDKLTICYVDGTDWTSPTWTSPEGTVYNTESFDPDTIDSPNACGNNASWKYEDGVLTIYGKGAMWDYNWSVDNLPWDDERLNITKVVIEEGITHVGDSCFATCINLEDLKLPSSLESIGEEAFYACYELEELNLPSNLTSIGLNAFVYCEKISKLTLPETLDSIGGQAFVDCGLSEVYFRGDVPTSWGKYGSWTKMVFDNSVTIYYPAGNTSGWTTPTWTAPDGTSYKAAEYVLEEAKTFTVTGNITSYGNSGDSVTIKLFDAGENVIASCVTTNDTYSLNATSGNYTLVVSKANHVTRKYEINVGTTAISQDVKICLLGDVTGDGNVNTRDWNRVYAHVNETSLLSDYALKCGDVIGNDGKVTSRDWNRLYAHINETNLLW